MDTLKFKRLHEDAVLPTRNEDGDAGLDIYALEDVEIPPCEVDKSFVGVQIGRVKVRTGISTEIHNGYEGELRSRSGLAFNSDIICFGGTIDSSYRGEIGILLYNLTAREYLVRKGDRVAQLVVTKCELPKPEWSDELSIGSRGDSGFGSSGR